MKKTNMHLFMNHLDMIRSRVLQFVFQVPYSQKIYQSRHIRIQCGFILTTMTSLMIAILRPDMLLVMGPMIYGYWHLTTSYKYSSFLADPKLKISKKQRYTLYILAVITCLEVLLHLYQKIQGTVLTPNAFLGLTLSAIYFIYLFIKQGPLKRLPQFLILLTITVGIIYLSWEEPLNFISISLFTHNWVAFLAWIKFSKDKKNSYSAYKGLLIFAVIHAIVLSGFFDSYLVIFNDYYWGISGHQNVSWILAPWSDNEIVWKRALCLYTFGLSVHYYIWLKAIPENIYKNKTPVSFKKSFSSLNDSCGMILTISIIAMTIIGSLIWIYNYELGSLIYFSLSNMHAWIELMMLFTAYTLFGRQKLN